MQNQTIELDQLRFEYPYMNERKKRSWIFYGLTEERIDILNIFAEEVELLKNSDWVNLILNLKTQSIRWLFEKNILTSNTRGENEDHILYYCIEASRLNPNDQRAIEMLDILLQAGVDIFSQNLTWKTTYSPLDIASCNLDARMVEYLFMLGVSPYKSCHTSKTKNSFYYIKNPSPVALRQHQSAVFGLFDKFGYIDDQDFEGYETRIGLN